MTPAYRKLLGALAAAIAILALPASAAAATGLEIAVQDDQALVTSASLRPKALTLASDLNATWIRANVLWAASMDPAQAKSTKKPATPKYDLTSYDALVLAARQRGINVELTLTGDAPAWATGNKKKGHYKPNATYFGQFARAVVTHFGSNVNRYSVWNEANLGPWLEPLKDGPTLYRALYKAGYSAIKSANPDAQVLIGETSPYGTKGRSTPPIEFLRKVLAGQHFKADGYAHHPYDFQHKPSAKWPGSTNATLGTLSNLTKELDRQAKAGRLKTPGGHPLDLYLTEYGYLRSGKYAKSESARAAYLTQAYDIALKNPRVRQMLQYLLLEPTSKYKFFDMSLANRNGKIFGAAFDALVQWTNANASKLNGAGG
jgi:hypothetical protein